MDSMHIIAEFSAETDDETKYVLDQVQAGSKAFKSSLSDLRASLAHDMDIQEVSRTKTLYNLDKLAVGALSITIKRKV